MYTIQYNPRKTGRPPLYRDPVDLQTRIERDHFNEIRRQFPNVTISRALSLIVKDYVERNHEKVYRE